MLQGQCEPVYPQYLLYVALVKGRTLRIYPGSTIAREFSSRYQLAPAATSPLVAQARRAL